MAADSAGGTLLLLLLCAAGAPALVAQSDPAYQAGNLACVSFRENIRSDLTLETGGSMASATSGREGVLIVSAEPARTPATLNIVAWFDSLQVWRTAGGQRTEPDASGVLGGRYRGELQADGTFSTSVRPFVPETLREVTELSSALDDLLPRLPPSRLQVGEEWRAGDSVAIKRLSDSVGRAAVQHPRDPAGHGESPARRYTDTRLYPDAQRSRRGGVERRTGTHALRSRDFGGGHGAGRWRRAAPRAIAGHPADHSRAAAGSAPD